MSDADRSMDQLLTKTAKQHLQTVDWDRMSHDIMGRVNDCPQVVPRRSLFKPLIAAAAVLILLMSLWLGSISKSPSVLEQIETGRLATGPMQPIEDVLYRTDPQTILLAENIQVLHSNPRLRPISVWEQPERISVQSP